MLKTFFGFLRREKWYVLLFLLLMGAYLGIFVFAKSNKLLEKSSPVVQEFENAEKKFQEKYPDIQALQGFLQENPPLFIAFEILTLFMIVAFAGGLMMDFSFFFKPHLRQKLIREGYESHIPWGIGMLFRVVVLSFLVAILSGIILGVLRRLFWQDLSLNFFALFQTTLIDLSCLLLVLTFIRPWQGSWRDIGLDFKGVNVWEEIKIGLRGYITVLPLFFGVLLLLIGLAHLFSYEPPPHPLVEVFLEEQKRSPGLVIYSVILAAIVGPIVEEVFFRGFCYPIFKRRLGVFWGMLLSSAFFSAIHYNEFAFIPILILGMALAYLYEKRRTLIASITLHVVHNSLFMAYFFVMKEIIQRGSGN